MRRFRFSLAVVHYLSWLTSTCLPALQSPIQAALHCCRYTSLFTLQITRDVLRHTSLCRGVGYCNPLTAAVTPRCQTPLYWQLHPCVLYSTLSNHLDVYATNNKPSQTLSRSPSRHSRAQVRICDIGVVAIAKASRNLACLDISMCSKFSENGLKVVSSCCKALLRLVRA